MSRSRWKGSFLNINLKKLKKKGRIKIWARDSVISRAFLDKKVSIYNGKDFRAMTINDTHLGYKFGEFAFTCKKRQKTVRKNKKK
jgi:ribosomal protein S19